MLSKKEAFKIIIDKIFEDNSKDTIDLRELVQEYTEDYLSNTVSEPTIIPPIAEDSIELAVKETPKKTVKPKPKSSDKYEYPETYRKPLDWILFNNGTVGTNTRKNGQYESYQLLNVFEKCTIPFTYEECSENVKILKENNFNQVTGMRLLYNFQKGLSNGGGALLDIIYDIYCHDYEVPMYVLFGVQNNQITINNVETGIKPFQVKQWIDELDLSSNVKADTVRLMKEYSTVSKKYLFTILKNYDNNSLLELLE